MQITRIDQALIGLTLVLVVGMGAAGWMWLTPPDERVATASGSSALGGGAVTSTVPPPAPAASQRIDYGSGGSGTAIVVDVQGAVVRPGLYHLVAGARVGDAIAAAGGYDSSVDLDAAATELNLAALLQDGEKVVVPRLRAPDAGGAEPGDTGDGEASGGLVDVNTADAAALEELPGIGPVTVERILAAREEAPFTSLEEMVERDVINNGQLEKIRDLATAG